MIKMRANGSNVLVWVVMKSAIHINFPDATVAGTIEREATLEEVIAQTGGESTGIYTVRHEGEAVGQLDMRTLLRALVPEKRSSVSS